jgi:mRNA interferase MazF
VRGDIYRLKRPRSAQGHEQQGERYAVVVQANAYDHLSTWLVAPTTTKSFGSMIHPTIEILGKDVRVLVEQTTAVDPQNDQCPSASASLFGPDRRCHVAPRQAPTPLPTMPTAYSGCVSDVPGTVV